VYQLTNGTRTDFVAKHVDKQSIELEILEHLRTIQPQSSRIISLIDTVPTDTGTWAILPNMGTLGDDLSMCSDLLCSKFAQLGCDLIEGLAYLHGHGIAHLDIKPSNLVYSRDFRLQIIDFGSAVWVESEDDMVEGIYGTRGWMAPEIGEQSVFSPIRADRWSCGKVLLCFHKKSGMEDRGLESFAEQLMDDNPIHRPSFVDWSEQCDATLCNDNDMDEMDEGGKKELKARADGRLENPTKRRRVEVESQGGRYYEPVQSFLIKAC
jgi:Protein kinase domain